jgi:hypothetical protein
VASLRLQPATKAAVPANTSDATTLCTDMLFDIG